MARRRKMPVSKFPNQYAVQYYRAINKMIEEERKAVWELWNKELRPLLHKYREMVGDSSETVRADADPLEEIRRKLSGMRRNLTDEVIFNEREINRAAETFVHNIVEHTRKEINAQFKAVAGVDPIASERWLEGFMKSAIQENVSYIKSIPQNYHAQLETIIFQGVRSGKSINEISHDIRGVADVSSRRAKFIARDQAGSLYGHATKRRHKELGLDKFRWITSEDERVRGNPSGKYPDAVPNHHELNGLIFEWDKGVEKYGGLLPGEDYNCRCIAEPIMEEILEEVGELDPSEVPPADNPDDIDLMDERRLNEFKEQLAQEHYTNREEMIQEYMEKYIDQKGGNIEKIIEEIKYDVKKTQWHHPDMVEKLATFEAGLSPVDARKLVSMGKAEMGWMGEKIDPNLFRSAGKLKGLAQSTADPRASYSPRNKFISWGRARPGALVHEMGHHLHENNKRVKQVVEQFFKRRIKYDSLTTIYSDTSEVGYRDKFINHYIGRDYGGSMTKKGTEVISMGIEYMFDNPRAFYQQDPEHFRLILAVMRGVMSGW